MGHFDQTSRAKRYHDGLFLGVGGDRQVQPTEPDKRHRRYTEMSSSFQRKNKGKRARRIRYAALQRGHKGTKKTRVVARYEIAHCATTPGLYIKHMWPATPTDLPLECWKGSFLVLSEGRTGGNASGTEGCERLPSFQCEGRGGGDQ